MPLITALIGGLISVLGTMVGRVLLALGLSYVTYTGLNVSINFLLQQITSNMNSMPTDVVAFLGWLWVDRAVSMIFSAYAVAMAFRMSGSTTFTKLVRK